MSTIRSLNQQIEIRILTSGNLLVKGLLVENCLSECLWDRRRKGFFKELVKTGAFLKSLQKQEAPKLLLNHRKEKEQKIIAFTFTQGKDGLNFQYEIEPSVEFLQEMEYISGVSFGFTVKEDGSVWKNLFRDYQKNYDFEREILEFNQIFEISMLTKKNLPAYNKSKIYVGDSVEALEKEESKENLNEIKKEIQRFRMKELENIKKMLKGLRK